MSDRCMHIGDVEISDNKPVKIIAELGVNHLGDFEVMKKMIKAAHDSGADLIKFQTFIAEKRYDSVNNPKGHAFIKKVKEWQFSPEQEIALWAYAREIGATVFTSVYDKDSVDFTEELECPAYKIAAFELLNHSLLKRIAHTKKPVVISRGMASKDELDSALTIFENHGCQYTILHCISSYPLEKRFSNLRMIQTLRDQYDCPIGHSDHTHGTEIPPFAVAAGALVIEKHFTITPKYRESDNFFSITPDELKDMIYTIRRVEKYMGKGNITKIETEEYMSDFRRITE